MRRLLMFLSALFLGFNLIAQTEDEEMQNLIDIVGTLRGTRDKTAWDNVKETLANDKQWTIMDELRKSENECRITDRTVQWFSINRMLSQNMGYENSRARGDFNSGEDPNFNYSLIERSVKAGAAVSYELKFRQGKQEFVVMPYETEGVNMTIEAYRGDELLATGKTASDGNIYLVIDADKNIKSDDVMRIVVTNNGDKNMAFVIINHNTRVSK
jgi:hypothetical protein